MGSIKFSVDEDQLRELNVIAANKKTSLNDLVQDYLSNLTTSGLAEADSMNGNIHALFDYSVGKIDRHGAQKILGVDDHTLSIMLRLSGFPPPRATLEKENEMLEQIKDVHFR
jgi:hypothetical protein